MSLSHLFDGFALLAFSFSLSSSEFRLNTFGLPSRSVCVPCHPYSHELSVKVYASMTRRAPHTKLILFLKENA